MTRTAMTKLTILTVLAALAPAAVAAQDDAPAPAPWVRAGFYGDPYPWNYRPACPMHYYYACWLDPYSRPQCGCLPGLGYYLNRY